MKALQYNHIQIQKISNSFTRHNCFVDVLRLDALHPIISGNKFFKLRFYIDDALANQKNLTTFGGAYSNHIVATAFTCNQNNIKCKGIIRGEKPSVLSETLKKAIEYGMQLEFVTRDDFKNLLINYQTHSNELIVPEGGYGILGCKGAATINECYTQNYDYIITAVGTGTTVAGLASNTKASIIGINVLKGNDETTLHQIENLLGKNNIKLIPDFHFGGYAKKNDVLINFMNTFYKSENIPTDFVYTAKMFYGLQQLITKKYFKDNSRILAIHTGGLQGNLSLPKGTLHF